MSQRRFRVGVIGDPVAHSISPAMHQPALDSLGVAATYERWHTPLADLPARIESLRMPDVLGANVTVPHKLAVMPLIDHVSALATRAGAVNTIVNRDGVLHGDNTDVYGFQRSLLDACADASTRTVLILGAGGAARGVALALEAIGVPRVIVQNRNPERMADLIADLAPLAIEAIGPDGLPSALTHAGIVVNATALGWHPGETPLAAELLDLCGAETLVVDLTYRDTDLLRAARARGLATLDGLAMLVHQGARALELWTGKEAPVAIMMDAAIRERAARA